VKKMLFPFVFAMMLIPGIFLNVFAESVSPKPAKAAVDSTKVTSNSAKVVIDIKKPLPKLVDLGSKGCIPCKKMAPILDSLRQEYKGRAEVIFIDTRENRQAGLDYKIAFIPTQVFIDTTGKEVFRHVGFFSADSIVAQFKIMGVK
jgi:thioredoxin 1